MGTMAMHLFHTTLPEFRKVMYWSTLPCQTTNKIVAHLIVYTLCKGSSSRTKSGAGLGI